MKDEKRICLNRSVLDFMESKLTPDSWVLEIGGGWSSRWFADRCGNLTIVETDPKWRRTIERELAGSECPRQICSLLAEVQGYGGVDLALVDCVESLRFEAVKIAWNCLSVGGWLLFDDAQRPQHADAIQWLWEKAGGMRGDMLPLLWQDGDVETAKNRLTLAWVKS